MWRKVAHLRAARMQREKEHREGRGQETKYALPEHTSSGLQLQVGPAYSFRCFNSSVSYEAISG